MGILIFWWLLPNWCDFLPTRCAMGSTIGQNRNETTGRIWQTRIVITKRVWTKARLIFFKTTIVKTAMGQPKWFKIIQNIESQSQMVVQCCAFEIEFVPHFSFWRSHRNLLFAAVCCLLLLLLACCLPAAWLLAGWFACLLACWLARWLALACCLPAAACLQTFYRKRNNSCGRLVWLAGCTGGRHQQTEGMCWV